jgi:hypothetical protein
MSYPRCSIAYEKEHLHSCSPSQDKDFEIDHVVYPMGEIDPLLPPIGPSDLEFLLEFDLTVCETSSPSFCESLSPILHDFLDVEC